MAIKAELSVLKVKEMAVQEQIHYNRIAEAIEYIQHHFRRQPSLEEIAERVHLSPSHFQRLFTDWAGTSPKKFLQYISVEYAKQLLRGEQVTLFDAAMETGLSSTSRLHDLFVNIEAMTPAEYKNEGSGLLIRYSFADSPFGQVLVASTGKGICHMAFEDHQEKGVASLHNRFPAANFQQQLTAFHQQALTIIQGEVLMSMPLKLHLKGTPFQLKVWEALLKIPRGKLSTYGTLAEQIGAAGASRAVGTAIGKNPVAYIIPCHRVIQSSGVVGGYMWGTTRKTAIIGWEAAQLLK